MPHCAFESDPPCCECLRAARSPRLSQTGVWTFAGARQDPPGFRVASPLARKTSALSLSEDLSRTLWPSYRRLRSSSRTTLTLPVNGRLAPPTRVYFALPTAILICFGLASSRFGSLTVSKPCLYSALIASSFTVFGSVKVRLNVP